MDPASWAIPDKEVIEMKNTGQRGEGRREGREEGRRSGEEQGGQGGRGMSRNRERCGQRHLWGCGDVKRCEARETFVGEIKKYGASRWLSR